MKNMSTGDLVKVLRTDKNFTQDDLSKFSGVSRRAIQRAENNQVKTQFETLKKILQPLVV